jgi:putative peptidoglycan lipid II flippase
MQESSDPNQSGLVEAGQPDGSGPAGPVDPNGGGSGAGRRRDILRSAAGMSIITMGSRVLGLVREQVRAHFLGTSLASDAFGIAFQIPNLLRRLVAEGAMSAGFIPVLSEIREKEGDSAALVFARQFFNLSLMVLALVTTLGVLGAGVIVALFSALSGHSIDPEALALTESLTRWMFPYIALVAWAAVMQGVLNTWRIFWVSAFTSVLLNIAIIGAALGFASQMDEPAYAFAFGVLVGGLLQLLFQVPYVFRLGFRWKPDFRIGPRVRQALWLLVPTVFGAGVYQINVLISQAIAWGLGDGAVSSLQYSSRLLELTLGVFAVAISTVVLPTLAADAAAGARDKVIDTVLYSVRLCCFVCFPVTAALMLLRVETASLLFERGAFSAHSAQMTGYALGFHAIGLTHIALARVLVPVFYAFKDTKTVVWIAVASMLLNISLCYALAPHLSFGGIALANSASAILQAMVLSWALRKHTGAMSDDITKGSLLRSAIATAAMAGVIWWLKGALGTAELHGFTDLARPYGIIFAAAVATYVGLSAAMRHPELAEFVGLVRRR